MNYSRLDLLVYRVWFAPQLECLANTRGLSTQSIAPSPGDNSIRDRRMQHIHVDWRCLEDSRCESLIHLREYASKTCSVYPYVSLYPSPVQPFSFDDCAAFSFRLAHKRHAERQVRSDCIVVDINFLSSLGLLPRLVRRTFNPISFHPVSTRDQKAHHRKPASKLHVPFPASAGGSNKLPSFLCSSRAPEGEVHF